jgi:hypothetical protein
MARPKDLPQPGGEEAKQPGRRVLFRASTPQPQETPGGETGERMDTDSRLRQEETKFQFLGNLGMLPTPATPRSILSDGAAPRTPPIWGLLSKESIDATEDFLLQLRNKGKKPPTEDKPSQE